MRPIAVVALSIAVGCGPSAPETEPPTTAEWAPAAPSADDAATGARPRHDLDGLTVELMGLDRGEGETLEVRWRFHNHTAEPRVLASGSNRPDGASALTADAFLVDRAHQKKYLVLVDENDAPVASRHGGPEGITIAPGETLELWAKFPAPATDTTRLSVHVPVAPAFENVRLPHPAAKD